MLIMKVSIFQKHKVYLWILRMNYQAQIAFLNFIVCIYSIFLLIILLSIPLRFLTGHNRTITEMISSLCLLVPKYLPEASEKNAYQIQIILFFIRWKFFFQNFKFYSNSISYFSPYLRKNLSIFRRLTDNK